MHRTESPPEVTNFIDTVRARAQDAEFALTEQLAKEPQRMVEMAIELGKLQIVNAYLMGQHLDLGQRSLGEEVDVIYIDDDPIVFVNPSEVKEEHLGPQPDSAWSEQDIICAFYAFKSYEHDIMSRLKRKYGFSTEDAEDIMQDSKESFAKAITTGNLRHKVLTPENDIESIIMNLINFRAIDFMRQKYGRNRNKPTYKSLEALSAGRDGEMSRSIGHIVFSVIDEGYVLVEEKLYSDSKKIIASLLQNLHKEERSVFVLSCIYGLRAKDIALVLGKTLTTVYSTLSHVRDKAEVLYMRALVDKC